MTKRDWKVGGVTEQELKTIALELGFRITPVKYHGYQLWTCEDRLGFVSVCPAVCKTLHAVEQFLIGYKFGKGVG